MNLEAFKNLIKITEQQNAKLIAVSKTKPAEQILELYNAGQRDFGENRVDELLSKSSELPNDINWHFIGTLQSKKVKKLIGQTHLIHSVDSIKLLSTIQEVSARKGIKTNVLLQIKIAQETTKQGFSLASKNELVSLIQSSEFSHVNIRGLMGMATFTNDVSIVKGEFQSLKILFDAIADAIDDETIFKELSMGMSGDYALALVHGSTMLRIGSALFGSR